MPKKMEGYEGASQIDLEMRRRIHTLTAGVKPTREMVQASIAPLLEKLNRARTARTSIEEAADRNRRAVHRAGPKLNNPSAVELAAVDKYRISSLETAKKLKLNPPAVQTFTPQIRSGSIWVGLSSPYTDRWTSGVNTAANHLVGTWSTLSSDSNQSLAGICAFFTPVPGRFNIRFAPYVSVSYSFYMNAFQLNFPPSPTVSRASSIGFVGAYVTAWDGRQWVEMADARQEIWNRRVSINDEVGDSGDSNSLVPQANFPAVGNPLTYALWVWGGVTTFKQDGTFGFAHSAGTISAAVPFMIIEQMI